MPVCLCGGSAETALLAAETQLAGQSLPADQVDLRLSPSSRATTPSSRWPISIVAETTCDGKKKMYELMAETRPMHVLELPQKPDDPDALEHWRREIAKLRDALEQRFGVEITDERLRDAIRLMNRERSLRRDLAALMAVDAPPLTGRELLTLKSAVSGIPADLAEYERALEESRAKPPDPTQAARVRVLMTGVPMAEGAERVMDIIEESLHREPGLAPDRGHEALAILGRRDHAVGGRVLHAIAVNEVVVAGFEQGMRLLELDFIPSHMGNCQRQVVREAGDTSGDDAERAHVSFFRPVEQDVHAETGSPDRAAPASSARAGRRPSLARGAPAWLHRRHRRRVR